MTVPAFRHEAPATSSRRKRGELLPFGGLSFGDAQFRQCVCALWNSFSVARNFHVERYGCAIAAGRSLSYSRNAWARFTSSALGAAPGVAICSAATRPLTWFGCELRFASSTTVWPSPRTSIRQFVTHASRPESKARRLSWRVVRAAVSRWRCIRRLPFRRARTAAPNEPGALANARSPARTAGHVASSSARSGATLSTAPRLVSKWHIESVWWAKAPPAGTF